MTVDQGEGAASYADLLPAVRPDRRAFPGDELRRASFRAVRVGGAALAVFFGAAAWGRCEQSSGAGAQCGVATPRVRGALGSRREERTLRRVHLRRPLFGRNLRYCLQATCSADL